MLRLTDHGLVPSYAIDCAKLIELRLSKFKTIISLKLLDLPSSLVLNKSLELIEHGERLIFLCQELNPDFQ